ncbi:MAG: hypothetical protein KAI72_04250, partial [Candidatus Pacebacteria bacterium]|nr:hypothetical protein [Candidatus Paceibacterota bacterium]
TAKEATDYFEKINEKHKNMKERHSTKDIVEEQINGIKKLPKDYKEVIKILKKNGFKEIED